MSQLWFLGPLLFFAGLGILAYAHNSKASPPGDPGRQLTARLAPRARRRPRPARSAPPSVVVVRTSAALAPAALLAVLTGGIAAGFVLGRETGAGAGATSMAAAVPTVAPSPVPPLVLPGAARFDDRTSCLAIEGTAYRSDKERLWYLANCAETPVPPEGAVP